MGKYIEIGADVNVDLSALFNGAKSQPENEREQTEEEKEQKNK